MAYLYFASVPTTVAALLFSAYLVGTYGYGIYLSECSPCRDSWRNHIDVVWTGAALTAIAVVGYFLGRYLSRKTRGGADDRLRDYFFSKKAPAVLRTISLAVYPFWPVAVAAVVGVLILAITHIDTPEEHQRKDNKVAEQALRAAEQAELASQNEAFGRFKALDYSVSLVSASRGAFGTPTIIAEMVDTDRGLDVLRQEAAIPADAAWVSSRTADIRRLIAGEKPSTTIFASSHNILELHAKLQALRDDAAMIGRMYFREAVSDSERLARGSQSPIPLSYLGRIRDAVQLVNRAAALINILRDELVRSRMPIPQEIKYGVNYVDAQLYQISYEQLQIGNLWFHSWGCGLSGMPELAKERNIDELDFAMSFGRLPNVTYVDGTNEHLSGRIQYPDTTKPYVGAEDCPR